MQLDLSTSLQTVLELVLELLWTRLPAALYAAGWSDEAEQHQSWGHGKIPPPTVDDFKGKNPILQWMIWETPPIFSDTSTWGFKDRPGCWAIQWRFSPAIFLSSDGRFNVIEAAKSGI